MDMYTIVMSAIVNLGAKRIAVPRLKPVCMMSEVASNPNMLMHRDMHTVFS